MKVGIICAGDEESAPFLPTITNCKITERAMLKFYEGQIQDTRVVVLYSGVCKVNAAIAAQILVDVYGVDIMLNSGTAGGMNPDLKIFDTVISTEVCYHDVAADILTEFHPWMKSVFFKADPELIEQSKAAVDRIEPAGDVFWGRMVTGESFITDEGRDKINDEFMPLTVDMETASIAHVCYVNRVPFLAIRCVTDTASHSGADHFEENCAKASVIAKDITVALLSELGRGQDKRHRVFR
ncbi:5'-methylthioadenosine/adenosylhomocysteine nucleosidase [Clostridium sp. AN503]|uniref:5'-methylthioadenosine/adenosylhomocysteine nucleosidase n=1 Tax=Clostridium sp. AN503 TaxID=3160598 RepID=UPI0034582E12